MRYLLYILCFALLAGCSAMMTGTGSSSGPAIGSESRSADQVNVDNALASAVRRVLESEASIQPATFSVSARNAVVTVAGTVRSFEARDRAVRLAKDVSGVGQVKNQIKVDTRT